VERNSWWFDLLWASPPKATVGAQVGDIFSDESLVELFHRAQVPFISYGPLEKPLVGKVIEWVLPMLERPFSLKFLPMPGGMDFATLGENRGSAALRLALTGADTLLRMFWKAWTEGQSWGSVEAREALEGELMAWVDLIPDATLRTEWRESVIRQLGPKLVRRPMVVRSNGFSHHSTAPGSIRLKQGIEPDSFSLKDAAKIAELAKAPQGIDVEALAMFGVTERTQQVIREIINLISTVPEAEFAAALKGAKVYSSVEEARAVLQRAGIRSLS
jgi:hypothetical protein